MASFDYKKEYKEFYLPPKPVSYTHLIFLQIFYLNMSYVAIYFIKKWLYYFYVY